MIGKVRGSLLARKGLKVLGSDLRHDTHLLIEALKADPKQPVVLSALGDILAASDRIEAARTFYLKALEYDSEFDPANFGLQDLSSSTGVEPELAVGDSLPFGYRVAAIRRGGYGIVYIGLDHSPGAEVALPERLG